MTYQLFGPRSFNGAKVKLPSGYMQKAKWTPKIGDIFPNFTARSTCGELDYWSWAEGNWTLLFSHPAAFTPVCTTEIAALAQSHDDFKRLKVKPLAMTASGIYEQIQWHQDIESTFDCKVWFPCIEDSDSALATTFGMMHNKEHPNFAIRKSFIVDPAMKIRLIMEYPVFIGRNVEEILRVFEALQLRDETGLATPADWENGDPVIVPSNCSDQSVRASIGSNPVDVLPYLRVAYRDQSYFP